jgi:hypothetical protein
VNFNTYIARVWVDRLTRQMLERLHGSAIRACAVRTKGELKDFSASHLTYTNQRIEQLVARYRKFPEDFYRETPMDGIYYSIGEGEGVHLVGTTRIKRFRRIAEKGSRRIVDYMLARIRAGAEHLAEERAAGMGISRAQLVTPPEKMVEEFAHAERRVIKSIKQGTIRQELPLLQIPDAVGIKLIVEDEKFREVMAALEGHPACRVVEVEPHRGAYNATNLIVEYALPRPLLQANPPSGRYLDALVARGFVREQVASDYVRFLEEGENLVRLEIIVSGFQDYLESEIGKCMHEDRITSQRAHPDYKGPLATNVRYLMSYILSLCRSPRMEDYKEIPIKLWSRYMADTVSYFDRALFLAEELFFDAVPEIVEVRQNGE